MPTLADAIAAHAEKQQHSKPVQDDKTTSRLPNNGNPVPHEQHNTQETDSSSVHLPSQPAAAPEPAEPEEELTAQERKALAALTNPSNRGSSFAAIAKDIGISESNFRRLRARPRFQKAIAGAVISQAKAAAPGVLNACIETAKMPGKEGFQDRKLLFQLAGILDDKGRPDGATADALKGMTSIADRLSQALSRAQSARNSQPGDDAKVIEHDE